ncbi:Sec-independent protein translocase protein TatA [Dietzia timorensis]|uniref:Sec-independent protein translocase protein TatA n=1 Tax=Dietzia timorensis TaxID=499555 RepID=A0A173LLE2_9ACTN|nr:Sec-independent protein translocase protein TatA [Dietzia timorensis]
MGGLSPWHLLIFLAVVVLLFGAKKLPDAARGLGRSMRIFKSEVKEMQHEGKDGEQPQQALPSNAQYPQGDQQYQQYAQPQQNFQQPQQAYQQQPQQQGGFQQGYQQPQQQGGFQQGYQQPQQQNVNPGQPYNPGENAPYNPGTQNQ